MQLYPQTTVTVYGTFCRSCRRRADTRSSNSFLSRCFSASVCAQILLWNAIRMSISSCSRCRRSLASATCVVSSRTCSQASHNIIPHRNAGRYVLHVLVLNLEKFFDFCSFCDMCSSDMHQVLNFWFFTTVQKVFF